MPIMPRMNKKATKIAYEILGKPANMDSKPTRKDNRINERLLFEETVRVR